MRTSLSVAAVAAVSMMGGACPLNAFGTDGLPATAEQRARKAEEKAFGAEEAIDKAKEKTRRKKKRNKLLVKLGGLDAV